jgi:hypothetical protein
MHQKKVQLDNVQAVAVAVVECRHMSATNTSATGSSDMLLLAPQQHNTATAVAQGEVTHDHPSNRTKLPVHSSMRVSLYCSQHITLVVNISKLQQCIPWIIDHVYRLASNKRKDYTLITRINLRKTTFYSTCCCFVVIHHILK